MVTGKLDRHLSKVHHESGVELYEGIGRYFAITGARLEGYPAGIKSDRQEQISEIQRRISPPPAEVVPHNATFEDNRQLAVECLKNLPGDLADEYDGWVKVGMALHSVDPSNEMLAKWIEWSQQSGKFMDGECERKWRSFGSNKHSLISIGSLIHWAKQTGWTPPQRERVNASNHDPMEEADRFIRDTSYIDGPTFRSHREQIYEHNGCCYVPLSRADFKARIWNCFAPKCRKFAETHCKNIAAAIHARTAVDSHREFPLWLGDDPAREGVAYCSARNGIIDLEKVLQNPADKACLTPHSPLWFSTVAVDFDYIPGATSPIWERVIAHNLDGDRDQFSFCAAS